MARRLALALTLMLAVPALAQAATPTVRVGFSEPRERASMVGFVHGMDGRRPADEMIEPLAPALWRGKLRDVPYERVQEVGGRYT
jgi:hypothetical protein